MSTPLLCAAVAWVLCCAGAMAQPTPTATPAPAPTPTPAPATVPGAPAAPSAPGTSAPPAPAKMKKPGPATSTLREYHTLKLGAGEMRYALVLPDGYDATKEYPVAIALPPGGQNEQMVEAGLARYWEAEAVRRGWMIVSPVNPSGTKLFDGTPGPVAALMDELDRTLHVESHKFHVVGVSNGGRAAFIGALQAPTRVASIIVLPGLIAEGVSNDALKPLAGVPIAMFAGEKDAQWVEGGKKSQAKLKSAGVAATLEIVPESGHLVEIAPARLFDLLESHRTKAGVGK